jgi:hypothetical protein
MATIQPFTVLTLDGNYELATRAGHEHMLTLKGTFDGATVTMTYLNNATGTYTSVDGGAWTAEDEIRFHAPSAMIRLAVTNDGASTSIAVNLLPIYTR